MLLKENASLLENGSESETVSSNQKDHSAVIKPVHLN